MPPLMDWVLLGAIVVAFCAWARALGETDLPFGTSEGL